tara:strand:- start:576 stop:749 length:174 start_codon:yes stop_codon:yes gene_type:complete
MEMSYTGAHGGIDRFPVHEGDHKDTTSMNVLYDCAEQSLIIELRKKIFAIFAVDWFF